MLLPVVTTEEPLEIASEQQQAEQEQAGALTVSVDDFSALEERIQRIVDVVKREREARISAEERAVAAEAQSRMQATLTDQLQNEVNVLRGERDHVRQRVERLLAQLDALEL
jgi:hypothetical protein